MKVLPPAPTPDHVDDIASGDTATVEQRESGACGLVLTTEGCRRLSVASGPMSSVRAPASFPHHTSCQADEVGRGVTAMLYADPARQIRGRGRRSAGSNFCWHLNDPAGSFSEYYSDLGCVVDDQLWSPEAFDGFRGLFCWGPPSPPFLAPADRTDLITDTHSAH